MPEEDVVCGMDDDVPRNMLLVLKLPLDNGNSTGVPVVFEEVLLLYPRLVLLNTALLPLAVLLLLLGVMTVYFGMFCSCEMSVTTFTLIRDFDRTGRTGGSTDTAVTTGFDGDTADTEDDDIVVDSLTFETDTLDDVAAPPDAGPVKPVPSMDGPTRLRALISLVCGSVGILAYTAGGTLAGGRSGGVDRGALRRGKGTGTLLACCCCCCCCCG